MSKDFVEQVWAEAEKEVQQEEFRQQVEARKEWLKNRRSRWSKWFPYRLIIELIDTRKEEK